MYRIGEFAKLTQVPIKTLRYYDAIGLLRPAEVDRFTSYRYYTAAEVERLNRILVFKDLGFSLAEIGSLVAENVPVGQIRSMLRQKRDELERSVECERERLRRAAARLELIEQSGHLAAHEVAVRHTALQIVASVRETLRSYDECEQLLEEVEHEVGRQRQRGAIWHACVDSAVDCEAFVFLPARVASRGRVRVRELQGERMASLVYRGEQDFMRAYRAIRAWLAVSGVDVVGPKRELFLATGGPGTEPVTEIQFPIGGTTTSAPLTEVLGHERAAIPVPLHDPHGAPSDP
jgi:DNA-binding transcriptional MerR regulator